MFTELKALVAYGIPLVPARNYADRHRGNSSKADGISHSFLDSHVQSMTYET